MMTLKMKITTTKAKRFIGKFFTFAPKLKGVGAKV